MNARKENERQILMIYENYGLKTAEDQLSQAIAKEWKSISLAKYEQYNPDAVQADSPAELAQKNRQNMFIHARTIGRCCTAWDDPREEYEAACADVEAADQKAQSTAFQALLVVC